MVYTFNLCGYRYNPYVQARSRIDQLKRLGHSVDKVWPVLVRKLICTPMLTER